MRIGMAVRRQAFTLVLTWNLVSVFVIPELKTNYISQSLDRYLQVHCLVFPEQSS